MANPRGEMNSSVGVCHPELAGGVSLGMGVWVMGLGAPGPGAEGHVNYKRELSLPRQSVLLA